MALTFSAVSRKLEAGVINAWKKLIRVGHLPITDHLVLGITKSKLEKGEETFQYGDLETVSMNSWQQVADSLKDGKIDAACVLAPTAMDLFKAGVNIKLILFTHKIGSTLITNKHANIKNLNDFAGKIVLIP